jgi:hypothetical protein
MGFIESLNSMKSTYSKSLTADEIFIHFYLFDFNSMLSQKS